MEFYYKKGRTKTIIKWNKPTKQSCKKFFAFADPLIKQAGYDTLVFGSCLMDLNKARDLDILITGQIPSYKDLEVLLFTLTDFALNNCNLRLDAFWVNDVPSFVLENNVLQIKPFLVVDQNPIEYVDTGTNEIKRRDLTIEKKWVYVYDNLVRGWTESATWPLPNSKPHLISQLEYIKTNLKIPHKTVEEFLYQLR